MHLQEALKCTTRTKADKTVSVSLLFLICPTWIIAEFSYCCSYNFEISSSNCESEIKSLKQALHASVQCEFVFLEKTPECVLTLSKVRSEYQEEERRKKKQFHIQFQKVLTIFFWLMFKVRKVVFGSCLEHLYED